MLSRYVVQVFSEWFWDSSICPCYYLYHIYFYIAYKLYLYCKIFIFQNLLASFLNIFQSPEIATSISKHVPFSLPRVTMSGLLLGIVLSVCTCQLHNMVTLNSCLVSADLVHAYTNALCLILSLFPCICWRVLEHTHYHIFMYCSFAKIGHADIMLSTDSSNCWHSLRLLSVSVRNIFVALYFICNAWYCVTTTTTTTGIFCSLFTDTVSV
jgi:hypothetical protein